MAIDLRRAQTSRPSLYAAIVGGAAAVFAVIATAVATTFSPLFNLDSRLATWAHRFTLQHEWMRELSLAISWGFYTTPLTVAVLLAIAVALIRREWRLAIWLALSGLVVLQGNHLLKLIFRRDRPSFDDPIASLGSYSFPSGHGAAGGMVAAMLVLITIVSTGRGLRRRLLIALGVAVGLLVAASRVFLGLHYLSDVTAGLLFGATVTVALWWLVIRTDPRLPAALASVTGSGRKRVGVVVNPAKVGELDAFKARVLQAALQAGWTEPLWYETTVEDPGHGQAQQALLDSVDLVLTAGGDGTVRAVCEELARTGVAVAIIPQGTGNLLARNLSIPLNLKDALEVAFEGQDRALDLAEFRTDSTGFDGSDPDPDGTDSGDAGKSSGGEGIETTFLVMAGLGLDAAVMAGVSDTLKDRVGWLAYVVSGIKSLRFPSVKVTICVDDGEEQRFRVRTVIVGNVGYLQGGIPLIPDAEFDDGELDIVVIKSRRFWGSLAIIVDLLSRRRNTNRIERLRGSKATIITDKPIPMQLDGDPIGDGTRIDVGIQPGVVLVRVPLAGLSTTTG